MQLTTTMNTQMQSVKAQIQARWEAKVWVTAVLLLLVFITGFAIVQYATPSLAGNDGYYHMKMGYLIRTQGLKPDFPYLPYTILNEVRSMTTTCSTMCFWPCLPPPIPHWMAAWR